MSNNESASPKTISEFVLYQASNTNSLDAIGSEKGNFYYHTQRNTAEKILNGSSGPQFWISPLSRMNDKQECEWHEKDKNNVFALCFSHASSESIPMWYLYSGITGEGIRIGITPQKMKGLIEDISCVYPVVDGKVDLSAPLYRGEDFSLDFGWIYYLGNVRIKYKKDTYMRQQEDDEAVKNFIDNCYFVKDYEWNYEKEFRIVFHIFQNPPERIALYFDKEKMMRKSGGLNATVAPELEGVPISVIAFELGLPERKISKSKLKIKMDLIGRNQSSIVDNFDTILEGIDDEQEIKKLKNAIEKKKCSLKKPVLAGV